MAAAPTSHTTHQERDLLVQLLSHLEAEPQHALGTTPGHRKAVRACRAAIAWIDQRAEGRQALTWGSGGIGRNFGLFIALSCGATVVFHPRPWTPWFVFGELAIAGVFGLGGGAFLGWIHWRASEEGRARLARECAKLDPDAERALAEEGMGKELAAQPGVLQSRCRGPAAPA